MSTVRTIAYWIVLAAACAVVVGSALSLLSDTDDRYLKMLDFPRLQLFWAAVLALPLVALLARPIKAHTVILLVGLVVAAGIQGAHLMHYTPLVDEAVPELAGAGDAEGAGFSMVIVNVKQSNREADRLLDYLRRRSPDVILAVETDSWWDEQLDPVEREYPYGREVINEVTYGMVLYSRLPLDDVEVFYHQNENVPAFAATASLPDGETFALHTVHPVPPTRFAELPDNEGEREVGLLRVADLVAESPLPAVIAGDFNDVAWAATDRLTGTEDLLFDVRVGRGLFNTFDATNPLMRWPLDHVLVTEGWAVGRLERGPDVGSDHYPLYVELARLPQG